MGAKTVGVALRHVCGHAGYHTVPQAESYEYLERQPCPECMDRDEEEDRNDVPKN